MNPIPRRSGGRRPGRAALLGLLACTLAAVLAAGCGDRSLIVRVDLLSFLTPDEKEAHYGPIPAGISDSAEVVQSRRLNLLPGLDDVTTVTDVQVEVGAVLVNLTGAAPGGSPSTSRRPGPTRSSPTPPRSSGRSRSTARCPTRSRRSWSATPTSRPCSPRRRPQIGIRVVLNSEPGGDPLEGDLTLTTLRAVVTGKQAVFE